MILAVAMWVFVVVEGTMLVGGLAEYNDKVGPRFGHEIAPDHTGPEADVKSCKEAPNGQRASSTRPPPLPVATVKLLSRSPADLLPLAAFALALIRIEYLMNPVQTQYNFGRRRWSPRICVQYHGQRVPPFLAVSALSNCCGRASKDSADL